MELHFQTQTPSSTKRTAFKPRNNNKFIGVRQRPSGRWVAEIKDTTQNIRMWLGTFETAEEAARAYDEAACLLRGSNTRTNFATAVTSDSPVASRIRKMLTHKLHGKKSSTSKSCTRVYSNVAPTVSTGVVPFRENKEEEEEEEEEEVEGRNDEEVYRPCFIDGSDEYGLCGSMGSGNSWMFDSGFELPAFDMNFFEESSGISETLYAMNGVQEYLDAVDDSSDSFWNLPPLHMS